MLIIILCWLVVFAVLISIGRIFSKNFVWFEYFWIGFAAVIVLLQIWSIFLPVNLYFLITILLATIIFTLLFKRKIKISGINLNFVFISALILLVISYYASQSVGWDDTLLYHLNAVKWANLYPVVPGLGNLHMRLGFNSSFFLFASMFNNWLMQNKASHLALFTIASVLSLEILWILLYSKDRNLKFFCLFVIPLIFSNIAKNEIIASLSSDFACLLLAIATAIEFLKGDKKSLIVAGILSVVLITIKPSSIVFSLAVLIFAFYELVLKNNTKTRLKSLFIYLSVFSLFIIPYVVRNYYLTGWLFYPLPILGMKADWAMPSGQVRGLYITINTWAKVPEAQWYKFIDASFWQWFPVWYPKNRYAPEFVLFFFSLGIVILAPLSKIFDIRYMKHQIRTITFIFISLVSILYVFLTAPDMRFGGIYIWLFFASVMTLVLSSLNWNKNLKVLTITMTLALTLLVSWPISFDTEPMLKSVRWDQAWPTETVNGILKPTKLDFCGNSDLPCSPENNNIKFRVPGDLSKGFAPIN